MWADRDGSHRKTKEGNIFIKVRFLYCFSYFRTFQYSPSSSRRLMQNLEKTTTTRILHDTFSDFGEILSCKVPTDKDGNSKGYGFVHFADPEAAKRAIEEVNGAQLGDSEKVVTVCEFLSRQERGDSKPQFTNIYVKNLPPSIASEEDLKGIFNEFGDITSSAIRKVRRLGFLMHRFCCHVPMFIYCCAVRVFSILPRLYIAVYKILVLQDSNGRSFGFVNFDSPESARNACEKMHETEIEDCKLFVGRAQTKTERQDMLKRQYDARRSQMAQQREGKNVYIKNLTPNVDEVALREAFSVRPCPESLVARVREL
jgi:polyadenylate-binding protein